MMKSSQGKLSSPAVTEVLEKPKRRASVGRHHSTNLQQPEDIPSRLGTSAYRTLSMPHKRTSV